MKFVLDLILTGKDADTDADQMVIHRPVLVDGDPLINSNKTVVTNIKSFEKDLDWVSKGVQALDRNPILSEFINALSEVIYSMTNISKVLKRQLEQSRRN